jgi:hypothetical protein
MKEKYLIQKLKGLSFLVMLSFFTISAAVSQVVTGGSGNWNSTVPYAPWPGGTIPSNTADIVIGEGHTLTVNGNRTCKSLTIRDGAVLFLNDGMTLTVSSHVTMVNKGDRSVSGSVSGPGSITAVTLNIGNGSGLPTIGSYHHHHELVLNAGSFSVSGNINLFSYNAENHNNRNDNARISLQSGTVTLTGTINTNNEHFNNNPFFTMETGVQTGVLNLDNAAPFNLSATGTSSMNFNGMNAIVNYRRSGNQTALGVPYRFINLMGSGVKTIANVHVHGTLSMQGTATATGTPIYEANSILEYRGSSAQTSGSEFTAVLAGNLNINNSNGVSLNSSRAINGNLILTSGILYTGTFTLTINENGSAAAGTANSHVNGKLARVYGGIGSKNFPIGKSGQFRPLTVNYTALTGKSTVTAEQMEQQMTGSLSTGFSYLENRFWSISQTGGSSFAADVTISPGNVTGSNIYIAKKTGGTITEHFGSTPNYTAKNLNSFGDFALINNACVIPSANAGNDQALCNTTTTILSANSPAPAMGTWTVVSGSAVVLQPNNPSSPVSNLSIGEKSVLSWSISMEGCSEVKSDNVEIHVYALPSVAQAGSDQHLCNISSSYLEASAPLTGTGAWSVISGSAIVDDYSDPLSQVSNLTVGESSVLVWTVSNGICAASNDTLVIYVHDLPLVSIDAIADVCVETNALTLSGGWPLGGVYSGESVVDGIFYPSEAGIGTFEITYSYTDINGCSNWATTEVTVGGIEFSFGPDITVCGECVSLGAGTFEYFTWSTGDEYRTIEVCSSKIVWLEVSDENGCRTSDTITITVLPKPTVDLGDDIVLEHGTSVMLDAGNPGSGYEWNTGENDRRITVTISGTYSVTVTNSYGCKASDEIVVTIINDSEISAINKNNEDSSLLKVYPNPNNGIFNISFNNPKTDSFTIHVVDLTGKVVYKEEVRNFSGAFNKSIDLSGLNSQFYFVQIITDTEVKTFKVSAIR